VSELSEAVINLMGSAFFQEHQEVLLEATQIPGKFNGVKYIEFLQQLREHYTVPIILIEDGAPYHKAKIVKEFIAKQGDSFQVESSIPSPLSSYFLLMNQS
jgi:hypothetical protein